MTDNPLEQPESSRETWEASAEATERLMRLQVWLKGLLAGGPSLAEAVKPWREGLPIYGRASAPAAAGWKHRGACRAARFLIEAGLVVGPVASVRQVALEFLRAQPRVDRRMQLVGQ